MNYKAILMMTKKQGKYLLVEKN